ncbi:hypothetical protein RHGRI_003718 [Rhododendron griersonianum]|uniref:Uncharacterized protein n=1 Tax=Rhododendron griersonianum TaxID=479676 RepID=A0AAV6L6U6_9ERIC|nr:hypothetical protein RHGRI_003718 [Rhododendron griersonianum]
MRSATASVSVLTFSHLCPFTIPITSLSPPNPNLFPHFRRPVIRTRYRRRDSNADDDKEFGRQRRWWYDYSPRDQGPGILEEFIDSIWIIKVFGSYFPLLPAFLVSMLLATGPTAFLLSLALLIVQSAFTFAFKKLWGEIQNNPKRKNKSKRKARVNTASNVEFEEEETKWAQKGRTGYRSWVGRDDFPVNEDHRNPSTFGGWDDLDRTKEFDMKYSRRSAVKGKFSRREREREMPLLLRLLVAVFPFLASWTKML